MSVWYYPWQNCLELFRTSNEPNFENFLENEGWIYVGEFE